MALAQLHGEHALVFHIDAFEQVGDDVEILVVADQPRVTVDHQHAHVPAAPDQHVQAAAVLAGLRAGGQFHHQRILRQALDQRRQLARLDLFFEHRGLDVLRLRRNCSWQAGDEKQGQDSDHERSSEKSAPSWARTKWLAPISSMLARTLSSRRNGAGQARGSEALPSISAEKLSLRSRSGSGTAASSALVYGCTGLRNSSS